MMMIDNKVTTKDTKRKAGKRSIVVRLVLVFLGVLIFAIAGFFVWALNVSPAEPTAYHEATTNPAVTITSHDGFITIRPSVGTPEIGLLFYPGARVEPEAYVAKLSAVANAANIQIAIGQPTLNLAFFSINQAEAMRSALPGVKRWYVGGHSLGGSMACLYASEHVDDLEGVVLFSTYCGSDISETSLRVLSITGGRDGVFPPAKIIEKRSELPDDALMIEVPGMNHPQIGNYGLAEAENSPTISDDETRQAIADATKAFFQPFH